MASNLVFCVFLAFVPVLLASCYYRKGACKLLGSKPKVAKIMPDFNLFLSDTVMWISVHFLHETAA